jgi:hypothetical protein
MDLLVMENLWWQQDIGKQYDLKGIGELAIIPLGTHQVG